MYVASSGGYNWRGGGAASPKIKVSQVLNNSLPSLLIAASALETAYPLLSWKSINMHIGGAIGMAGIAIAVPLLGGILCALLM